MHLKEFYAVTQSGSLYKAESSGIPTDRPVLTKLALTGTSEVSRGTTLEPSRMLSIGWQLVMFDPCSSDADPRQLWHPNTHEEEGGQIRIGYRGSQTSPIVALFIREADARRCLSSGSLKLFDRQWLSGTEEVFAAIGTDHPHFSIARHPKLAFLVEKPSIV